MTPPDRQLARRLARDARLAERQALRAARVHARVVVRQEQRRRQARHRLPRQVVICVGAGIAYGLGHHPFWGWVSFIAGLLAVRSVLRLCQPVAKPPPPTVVAPRVPPPPDVKSAAFPAVKRLEAARDAMTRLVPLVAPAGRDAADEAWRCASDNDLALRWQAARLAAVEPHRGAEPALMDVLYSGVVAQESLVAGLADLVSASADPHAVARLQDATDALHGLAAGLRAVR